MVEFRDIHQRGRFEAGSPGDMPSPGWALGLRQLYKPVVDASMPADFDDLLARLEVTIVSGGSRGH